MKDKNSLSHTKWNCKYHIVFAPKYRRQAFYGVNVKYFCRFLVKINVGFWQI